jgi:uncharacterized membrane protein YphA (DoxX/SURF4 family)
LHVHWNAHDFWSVLAVVLLLAGFALVIGALTWVARKLAKSGPSTKYVFAVLTLGILIAAILLVDAPGNATARKFFADRAILTGVATSVLLLLAGLLAVDAEAERRRNSRRDHVLLTVFAESRLVPGPQRPPAVDVG